MKLSEFKDYKVNQIMGFLGASDISEVFEGNCIKQRKDIEMDSKIKYKLNNNLITLLDNSVKTIKISDSSKCVKLQFADCARLYLANQQIQLQKQYSQVPQKTFQLYINDFKKSDFEKRHLTIFLNEKAEVAVTGYKKNIAVTLPHAALNLRATESNVLPFLQKSQFYYSVIINFSEKLEFYVHNQITHKFKNLAFIKTNSEYSKCQQEITLFVQQLKYIFKELRGFAAKIPNATDLQKSAHSQICAVTNDIAKNEEIAKTLLQNFEFVPALYLSENCESLLQKASLPNFVYFKNEYQKLENVFNCFEKSSFKASQSNQVKIMSWNIQAEPNLMYEDATFIENPFCEYLEFKLNEITKQIAQNDPDVVTLCEAAPISHLIQTVDSKEQIVINNVIYHFVLTKMSNEFPYYETGHGTAITAVMYKADKFEFMQKDSLYFNKMAVSKKLYESLGGHFNQANENVEDVSQEEYEFLKPMDTYNTATYVQLKHVSTQRIMHVVAAYPHWNPAVEPYKYLSFKYVEKVLKEKMRENDTAIVAGDFNVSAASATSLILNGFPVTPKQCDNITAEYIEEVNKTRSKPQNVLKFQDCFTDILQLPYFKQIEMKSAYGQIYKNNVDRVVLDCKISEPAATTKTSNYEGTLDYIYASLKSCKIISVDDVYSGGVLPNGQCVSDHVPIACVIELL